MSGYATLAGKGLIPTSELESLLGRFHQFRPDSDLGAYHGSLWSLPIPSFPEAPPVELNRLYWPTGASRCATYHTVLDDIRLDVVREAVDADGYVTLVLNDGTRSITTNLYLTDIRPLFQITGKRQLYLVSLADQRWLWRWKSGSVSSTPASWSSLFSTLGTALGVTITVSSVDSDYGTPSSRWVQYRKPLSTLLDAAATAVGQRVVVDLDGSVSTVKYAAANTATDTNVALVRKMLGGLIDSEDVARVVPANVMTVFGKTTAGVPQSDPHTVSVSLASLALTEYGAATGVTGTTATVVGDLIYDGTNGTAATNYATQAATDWYGWHLRTADVTLPGIWDWTPTGAEDYIEWRFQGDNITTSIRSGPRQTLWHGEYAPPQLTSSAPGVGCGLTIDGDGNYALDTEALAGDGLTGTGCEFNVDPGCGLEIDVDGKVAVKTSDLVGDGLVAGTGCALDVSVGEGLTINAGDVVIDYTTFNYSTFLTNLFLAHAGCGLRNDAGVLKVDFETGSEDGLHGDNTACFFGVNYGCHLDVGAGPGTEPDPGKDALNVTLDTIAGDNAETALVVYDNGGCDNLKFDRTSFSTTTETLVTDVSLAIVGGNLRLSKTRVTYTNNFNEAGVHINRTAGSPVTTDYNIDPCLFEDCCAASALGATTNVTPGSGAAPLTVNFTTTPSGGVAPYTFAWTFEDGTPPTSTAEDPGDVEFNMPGTYAWTLTITDACGRIYQDDGTVTADGGEWMRDTGGDYTFTPVVTGDHTIRVYGAGGDGAGAFPAGPLDGLAGGGGGGGGFSEKVVSLTASVGESVTVGAGGVYGAPSTDGGDSYFRNSTTVMAKGGTTASDDSGAAGGSSASGYGTTKYSGGAGAAASGITGGGGGSSGDSAGGGSAGSGSTGGAAGAEGGDGGDADNPGVNPGGAAGGSLGIPSGGADGKVIITW